jgi:carbon-monoxide dehydrogenase medium subunit
MKAPPFAYARPASLAQAFDLIARHGDGAVILAGGQSLMASLNMRLSAPELLVDINRIDGLGEIAFADGTLRIGALVRHVELEHSALVASHAPLITQAMPHVAHPAIRNRGTLGGSLAFADPAAELPACMVALGARFELASATGARTVPAAAFYEALYRTALVPGEILVAVEIPEAAAPCRYGFAEFARRLGDYAIAGVAVRVTVAQGRFEDAAIVCFGAGTRPVAAATACLALAGHSNTAETRAAVAAALAADLDPPEDLQASGEMRLHLAQVLTRRVLEGLAP